MDPTATSDVLTRVLTALRWIARIAGVVSSGVMVIMLIGSATMPTVSEAVGLAFFPLGVSAGMLWAWRDEIRGGLLTALSLAGFFVWMFTRDGKLAPGPYFVLFSSPGLVLLACGLVARLRRRS